MRPHRPARQFARRLRAALACALACAVAAFGAGAAPAAAAPAKPEQFRFCSMDVDFAPFAKVDGSGHWQYLVAQAAKHIDLPFVRAVEPRRRCIEDVKSGRMDGMIAAFSSERAVYGAFPMAGTDPDEASALGVVRYFTYRRSGGALDWDGQRFTGLGDGAIGVESGFVIVTERLRLLGVPADEGSKTLEQNMGKLDAGRLAGVIAMDVEAARLLAGPYAGKLERIGTPFAQTPLYLMLSKPFQARYPEFAARYWQAINAVRASGDYRQYQLAYP